MFISIRVLEDNYTHILYTNEHAIAFDCVEPQYVLELLKKDLSAYKQDSIHKNDIKNLPNLKIARNLLGFFTSHRHLDHSNGDDFMGKRATHYRLNENESIKIDKWAIKCISTPCHTIESVCYFIQSEEGGLSIIVTGDTLFMLGCGKFNEGTPEMMFNNFRVLEKLEGIVLYGHDYNKTNIAFSEKCVDIPETIRIKRFLLMGEEAKYNPFMICKTPEELGKLRKKKDNFKS